MMLSGKRLLYRALLRSLLKRVRPPRPARTPVEGLPEGLRREELDAICLRHFVAPPVYVATLHLSAWKTSGAHRLYLRTADGREHHLIFKTADYRADLIPAVSGLPVRPGPPEYAVFGQARAPLTGYLPTVLICDEIVPGEQYRYLMEDLSDTHHHASSRRPEDSLTAVEHLPALHAALAEGLNPAAQARLLRYGREFSAALVPYLEANLRRYADQIPAPELRAFWERWPAVRSIYLRPPFHAMLPVQPIHGDFNLGNLWISEQEPGQIKAVDWEWAGTGYPHADLASLLRPAPESLVEQALAGYAARDPRLSPADHRRLYDWCTLERGLLDASFLAGQQLDTERSAAWIPGFIAGSLERVQQAACRLE